MVDKCSNFTFVKEINDDLYNIACECENLYKDSYFESSTNSARKSIELLIDLLAHNDKRFKEQVGKNLAESLRNLKEANLITDDKTIKNLNFIKRIGNEGSHAKYVSTIRDENGKDTSLLCIRSLFEVLKYVSYKFFKHNTKKEHFDNELYVKIKAQDSIDSKETQSSTEQQEYKDNLDKSSLQDYFKDFDLTSEQKLLVARLDDFLSNQNNVFILKGSAGTGKTFIVSHVARYLASKSRPFYMGAPTGKASRILQKKTNMQASTIHKIIYEFHKDIKDDSDLIYLDDEIQCLDKPFFEVKRGYCYDDCVFFADEASMLYETSNSDDELIFGSGNIIKDLLSFIDFSSGKNKKLIFIGDNCQLPPIGSNSISTALSKEHLESAYKLKCEEFSLTEIVRQKQDSGIISNASILRDLIVNDKKQVDFNFSFEDVHKLSLDDLIPTYLKLCNYEINDKCIFIAKTNASVYKYNQVLRHSLFKASSNIEHEVKIGEKLLCIKNTDTLQNGDFFYVEKILGALQSPTIRFKLKDKETGEIKEQKVELHFLPVLIKYMEQDSFVYKEKYILLNTLFSDKRSLSNLEIQAQKIFFRTRHPHLKERDPLYATILKVDPFFNALQVKFGYAITGHKAQGSEWESVIVDCNPYFKKDLVYYRWLYTSLTRASDSLYLINSHCV